MHLISHSSSNSPSPIPSTTSSSSLSRTPYQSFCTRNWTPCLAICEQAFIKQSLSSQDTTPTLAIRTQQKLQPLLPWNDTSLLTPSSKASSWVHWCASSSLASWNTSWSAFQTMPYSLAFFLTTPSSKPNGHHPCHSYCPSLAQTRSLPSPSQIWCMRNSTHQQKCCSLPQWWPLEICIVSSGFREWSDDKSNTHCPYRRS